MRAVVHGAWAEHAPRCPECARPGREDARREWGCDAPAERPVFHQTCACEGLRESCETCGGTGLAPVYRCPSSHQTPEIRDALAAYCERENGFLPVAGGLLDQAAAFIDFCKVVSAERGAIERAKEMHRQAIEAMKGGAAAGMSA